MILKQILGILCLLNSYSKFTRPKKTVDLFYQCIYYIVSIKAMMVHSSLTDSSREGERPAENFPTFIGYNEFHTGAGILKRNL